MFLKYISKNYAKNNNFKLVSACFSGIKTILRVFGEDLVNNGKFKPILDVILSKMKEHDAEKQVKINVITCLGPIFSNIFEKLNEPDQILLLKAVEEKLNVEMDKGIILNQIAHLPNSYSMKKSQ